MKKLFLLFALIGGMFAFSSNIELVSAEEEIVYASNVVVDTIENGDIIVDVLEGNVGDKVTFKVSPYVLYKVETVTVNGVAVTPNNDGIYEFLLVEGENKVSATFVVNKAELETIAGVLADARNGDWSQIFTLDNMLTFISWMITTLLSSGFFITLIKSKKIQSKTAGEISGAVEVLINSKFGEMTENFLNNTVMPIMDKYNVNMEFMDKTMKAMARCFMLAQENTPEARLAIVEELTKLNNNEKDLREEVKEIIEKEVAKSKEETAKLTQDLEDLKRANQEITSTASKEDEEYGQI